MIYFIVTACLFDNCELRQAQYTTAIIKLRQVIQNLSITNYKLIVVENNGSRHTYLNLLGCEVFYTDNNFSKIHRNKGYKELQDILDCIKQYNISDTDFIVKMTGRYVLEDNSKFMNIIKDIHKTHYDCVIKYGSYGKPVNYKMDDCITGLIGMRCNYVKEIMKYSYAECIEWNWARVTYAMNDKRICAVQGKLGIYICPGSNTYFLV